MEQPPEDAAALRAKWEADKLRTREGAQSATLPAFGQTDLEAALRANPDDRDIYLVYADWLSEQGDDWGQLIVVQDQIETLPRFGSSERRAELTRSETLLLFRLSARLWGVLGETVFSESTQKYLSDLVDATWKRGFLHTVRLRNVDADTFRTIVSTLPELPIARILRVLTFEDIAWEDEMLDLVVAQRWPMLERLEIFGGDDFDAARLAPLFTRLPQARHLILWGVRNADVLADAIVKSPIASQLLTMLLRRHDLSEAGRVTLQQLAPRTDINIDG